MAALAFIACWLTLSAIAAPIVGCVIAGRSVWSMFRALEADCRDDLDAAE